MYDVTLPNLNFLDKFSTKKILTYQILWNSELFHADRRTDNETWQNLFIFLDILSFEDGIDTLSRNVAKGLPLHAP
jgi:hypothetical protein